MKLSRSAFLAVVATLLAAVSLPAQVAPPAAPRARTSPHETINAMIEGTYQNNPRRVVIVYGRPYSKAPGANGQVRKIWGTLVPWDKVWRLGSDEATLMITESNLQIGDTTVPAGAYTLYMLPSESGTSKLIINKQLGQWGLTYDEKQDLGRVDLKKDDLTTPVDQFTMAIQPKQGGGGGTLKLFWESTQYSVEFTVKK